MLAKTRSKYCSVRERSLCFSKVSDRTEVLRPELCKSVSKIDRPWLAQVTRRLFTMVFQVHFLISSCGIFGGPSGARYVFILVLRFCHANSAPYLTLARYNRFACGCCAKGLALTPLKKGNRCEYTAHGFTYTVDLHCVLPWRNHLLFSELLLLRDYTSYDM